MIRQIENSSTSRMDDINQIKSENKTEQQQLQ